MPLTPRKIKFKRSEADDWSRELESSYLSSVRMKLKHHEDSSGEPNEGERKSGTKDGCKD